MAQSFIDGDTGFTSWNTLVDDGAASVGRATDDDLREASHRKLRFEPWITPGLTMKR
jgi:hypothetical protein